MSPSLPNGTWRSWFDAYGRKLILFARQWSDGTADAEDIVQEAFVRFWRSPHRNDADAHVQLYAMVRRAGIDHARGRRRREVREQVAAIGLDEAGWFDPAANDDASNRERELQAALAQLPDEQREVVVLKIWGELTFEQVARSLEIPANTAASRYRYGLEALRRRLTPVTP
jgi:RNA polymerase sigma-70 factor (ECF subfamily)